MNKYLYYNSTFYGLCRKEASKETACYYMVNGRKISKKRMKSGSGFYVIHYHEETPELLKQYNEEQRIKNIIKEYSHFIDVMKIKPPIKVAEFRIKVLTKMFEDEKELS